METKHTPGPWEAHRGTEVNYLPPDSNMAYRVAYMDMSGNGVVGQRHAANARLIAAAPDLLEACEASLAALDFADQDRFDGGALTKQLREAIAKAQGQAVHA